jgi:hypothetical protein
MMNLGLGFAGSFNPAPPSFRGCAQLCCLLFSLCISSFVFCVCAKHETIRRCVLLKLPSRAKKCGAPPSAKKRMVLLSPPGWPPHSPHASRFTVSALRFFCGVVDWCCWGSKHNGGHSLPIIVRVPSSRGDLLLQLLDVGQQLLAGRLEEQVAGGLEKGEKRVVSKT